MSMIGDVHLDVCHSTLQRQSWCGLAAVQAAARYQQKISACVCGEIVTPVTVERDLDAQLTIKQQVDRITRIKSRGDEAIVSAFVLSRFDYCNAALAGLRKST